MNFQKFLVSFYAILVYDNYILLTHHIYITYFCSCNQISFTDNDDPSEMLPYIHKEQMFQPQREFRTKLLKLAFLLAHDKISKGVNINKLVNCSISRKVKFFNH